MSWEYEDLFNCERKGDGSFIEEPSFLRIGQMGYRRRTTISGPRLDAEVFPCFGRDTRGMLRREKKNITREAQQKANDRRSELRLIQTIEANFSKKDIWIGLSYDDHYLPDGIEKIKRDVKNYLNRVRRARKKRGLPELKAVISIGGSVLPTEEEKGTRAHAHVFMSGGMSRDELEEIWGKGTANTKRLQPRDEGLSGISVYSASQKKKDRPESKGEKSWWGTRNLIRPEPRSRDAKVPNNRVKRIAFDFRNEAKEIMEKLYPGYRFQDCKVYYSEVVDGVYIRCVMRKAQDRRWMQ